MASVIKIKRNNSTGVQPSGGDLQAGELAINLADKKLFSSTNGSDVIQISGDAYELGTVADTDGATVKLTGTGNASNTQVVFTGANGIGVTSDGAGAITITANTVDVDLATAANTASANLILSGGGETETIKIVGDDHLVVAGTNTSHISVKLNNAVSVASVTTTGDATIGGDADITGEVNAATAAITTSLQVGSSGGPAANGSAITVGTVGGLIYVSNNNLSLGNSTVNTSITSTALHSDAAVDFDSTLSVASDITAGADVDITGEVNAASAAIVGNATVGGNMSITGDLTVSGTTTTVSSTTVTINDNMLSLADNSTATDSVDTGFYGTFGNSTATEFFGVFRDQSANTIVAVNGLSTEPGDTATFTASDLAQFDAVIDGGTYT